MLHLACASIYHDTRCGEMLVEKCQVESALEGSTGQESTLKGCNMMRAAHYRRRPIMDRALLNHFKWPLNVEKMLASHQTISIWDFFILPIDILVTYNSIFPPFFLLFFKGSWVLEDVVSFLFSTNHYSVSYDLGNVIGFPS